MAQDSGVGGLASAEVGDSIYCMSLDRLCVVTGVSHSMHYFR